MRNYNIEITSDELDYLFCIDIVIYVNVNLDLF